MKLNTTEHTVVLNRRSCRCVWRWRTSDGIPAAPWALTFIRHALAMARDATRRLIRSLPLNRNFFSPRDSILFCFFSHCINFDFINEMNENVEIFLSGNFPPNRRRIFRWKWMNPLTNFNKLIQILKVNQRKMSEFPPKTEISAE